MKTSPTPTEMTEALELALGRDVVPSAKGSRALAEMLGKELRAASVFSARTTRAEYLQAVRTAIEKLLGGKMDMAQVKLELKRLLATLGYTPESGFPGDEALGIPPAEPGSLQDLGSTKRLKLIIDTEIKKHQVAAQKARGLTPEALDQFPAWELVRIQTRRVPRGLPGSGTLGWQRRWFEVGGPMNPEGRLVALKTDPVWENLGSRSYFDDALDLDHPPFAFNSGMGWRAVSRAEAVRLGLLGEDEEVPSPTTPVSPIPESVATTDGLDDDMAVKLLEKIRARRGGKDGELRRKSLLEEELRKAVGAGVTDGRALEGMRGGGA